jgi:phage protein D
MSAIPAAYVVLPRLLIGGRVDDELSRNVAAILVEETAAGLYRAEVQLANWGNTGRGADFLYFKRDIVDFGQDLEIQLGPRPATTLFQGRITALEADFAPDRGPTLTVLAEDLLQDLRMTRRTRSFADLSDEEILRQIAGEHSLQADLALPGPRHTAVAQVNQSDLAFARARARAVGGEVWVKDKTFYAKKRQARAGGASIDLQYGVNLSAFSVRADLAHQCTELRLSGWDVAGKTAINATGGPAAVSSELNGGTGGEAILAGKLWPRREQVVHMAPLTVEEGRALAEALFAERARRFVTGTGALNSGDGRVQVGVVVNITDVGPMFGGKYVVVQARHTYDAGNGYRTEFEVERAGIG